MTRDNAPYEVRAWDLAEGDQLLDDRTVIAIHRNATARTVDVVTDEPLRATLDAEAAVPVVRFANR